jgi:hypothetical protein
VFVARPTLRGKNKNLALRQSRITRLIPGEDRTYGVNLGKDPNSHNYTWATEEQIYIEHDVILPGKTSMKDRKVKNRIFKLKEQLLELKDLLDIASGTDRIKYDTARTMANNEIKFLEDLLTFSA